MTTIKSFTDLSQSKTLSKILPLESADMYYLSGDEYDIYFGSGIYEEIADWLSDGTPRPADIPCWSLAALLGVLPKEIIYNEHIAYLEFHVWEYSIEYVNNAYYTLCVTKSYDNPIDACVAMIEKLHELNLL